MISNERKEELYNTWYSWSDWTDAGRQAAWEEFLDNLLPDEQEYIAHISALYQLWLNNDFDEWEEDDWYISLPSDDQVLIDAWNKKYNKAYGQLLIKNIEQERKQKEEP